MWVRHLHSSLNCRIKIKSLRFGNYRKVCVNRKVSQTSVKLSLRQRSLSFKCVVWTCGLSPALLPLPSVALLFFKRRRRQRWWRRRRGRERSWSSASGWRRLTGSIWGSLCGRPPHSAGCPPRWRRSCEGHVKSISVRQDFKDAYHTFSFKWVSSEDNWQDVHVMKCFYTIVDKLYLFLPSLTLS